MHEWLPTQRKCSAFAVSGELHEPTVYDPQVPVTPAPKLANPTPSMTALGPQVMTPEENSGTDTHSTQTATVGGAGALVGVPVVGDDVVIAEVVTPEAAVVDTVDAGRWENADGSGG